MAKQERILVVDDDTVIREGLRRVLTMEGYLVEAQANGRAAMERLQEASFDLLITDLKMPGMSGLEVLQAVRVLQPEMPVILITGFAAVDNAVEVMKNGAADYLAKPFANDELVAKVRKALETRAVLLDELYLRHELHDLHGFDCLIGESGEMQKVYQRILQVAPTDSTVLITGESGTGKELVARAIHAHSQRREQPFVAVDCTSLAESLLESELFGHVKGSFTGAIQTKRGLFEVADGGTLMLDEIGNLSAAIQAKLLRVLQEREVTPIGGTRPTPINIRLIAATNANLRDMVARGEFRYDLFFRLNIIPIDLPPLRERKGDLKLLAGSFLKRFSAENLKEIRGFSPEALRALEDYDFPGNVRELENLIERAVVLAQGEFILPRDLELPDSRTAPAAVTAGEVPRTVDELKERKRLLREQAVEPLERAFLIGALERNGWNVTRAAEEVGILRPNFQAMLKKLGISARHSNARS
ncbi:MAG: sigma-54-dependent Fis family transcriptional regulator [Deltaproteobacteria bacterium]|nr:MAG: sigma-54-dependent Fis family transcriptional regulator [Deltaproteobacteria bacterium]